MAVEISLNFVERYIVLCQQIDDLDTHFSHEFQQKTLAAEPATQDPNIIQVKINTLENTERQLISEIVNRCGGNKSRAALLLNISRNTVNTKLSKQNSTLTSI